MYLSINTSTDLQKKKKNGTGDDMDEIYDLKSAVAAETPLLVRTSSLAANHEDTSLNFESNQAPNLALNLGRHIVSSWELYVVAIIGTVLQLGVMLFAGLTGVYEKEEFMKDGKQPQKYALSCTASGTVALVIGMILCSHLVQRSTDEQSWEFKKIDKYRAEVVWLQKGRVVNDQQFSSYIIRRDQGQSMLRTKFPRLFQQRHTNTQHPLMTSHRAAIEKIQNQATLTFIAIMLSLIGFFLQFIGLRGLNWSVTIAQLVSVIIMTLLRAIVRRNMAYDIPSDQLESDHELDETARRIKNCSHWNIVTVPTQSLPTITGGLGQSTGEGPSQPTTTTNSNELASSTHIVTGDSHLHMSQDPIQTTLAEGINLPRDSNRHTRLAHRVFNARCQLEKLCPWEFAWQTTADLMTDAIDSTMNFIYTSPDVYKVSLGAEFRWKLSIQVAADPDNKPQAFPLEDVELKMSREFLSEGRGWGSWKADKSQIHAALGLWMLHFKLESKGMRISTEIDRVIDMGKQSPVETYEKWIRRQEKYRVVHHGQKFVEGESTEGGSAAGGSAVPYRTLIGYPSGCPSNDSSQDLIVVRADSPLDRICGQIIFSEFMASVVSQAVESIGGQVLARGGDQWLKASIIGLRNTVLDELANKLEETGLATADEAYVCIIPSLATNNKLRNQTDSAGEFIYKAKEVKALLGGGRFEQAELVLWWLLDDIEYKAKRLEAAGKWNEACEAYAHLWDAYDSIEGAKDFAEIAEAAMGRFCKRLFTYYKNKNHSEPLQATMNDLQIAFGSIRRGEAEWKLGEEWWNKCRDILKEWGGRDINQPVVGRDGAEISGNRGEQ